MIELLVVVTIIVVLLAILMPSIRRAVAVSQRTVCSANLRQMGLANLSYAADYFGRNTHERPYSEIEWLPKLALYMGGAPSATEAGLVKYLNGLRGLRCPTASEPGPGPDTLYPWLGTATEAWIVPPGSSSSGQIGSFGVNMWTEDPSQVPYESSGPPSWFFPYVRQVVKPGNTPIFGDCMWGGGGWPGGLHDGAWPQPPVNPNAPSSTEWGNGNDMLRFALYRHDRGVNINFIDGHTQWVGFNGVWGLQWNNGYVPRSGPPWQPAY